MIFYGDIAGEIFAVASAGGYQHRQRPAADAARLREPGALMLLSIRRASYVRPLEGIIIGGAGDYIVYRRHTSRCTRGVELEQFEHHRRRR